MGNDPIPGYADQLAVVSACLDNGISWFDTTYRPERLALGRILKELGRRDEATIIAWNFFTDFGPEGDVGGLAYYRDHHIRRMLDDLGTDHIDCQVVHDLDDPGENLRQTELAVSWQEQALFGSDNPYEFMVKPYNLAASAGASAFVAGKALGWKTLACSPFVRGRELERLRNLSRDGHGDDIAAKMLRFSLFQPFVDRLVVSMRRVQWVERNIAAARQGPLTEEEAVRLMLLARGA